MIDRLTGTPRNIRALALCLLPGAIVLAEQAVDDHVARLTRHDERLSALDALSRELVRIGQAEPGLAAFLGQVESYIGLLHAPAAA